VPTEPSTGNIQPAPAGPDPTAARPDSGLHMSNIEEIPFLDCRDIRRVLSSAEPRSDRSDSKSDRVRQSPTGPTGPTADRSDRSDSRMGGDMILHCQTCQTESDSVRQVRQKSDRSPTQRSDGGRWEVVHPQIFLPCHYTFKQKHSIVAMIHGVC
jgi:hypothetical protein